MKKFMLYILFPLFLLNFCGCDPIVTPIINIGIQAAVMWKEGEAQKYYDFESATVYRAAKHASENLQLPILKDEPQEGNSYYLSLGQNDRFSVHISKIERNITLVKVRVNFMGDKPYAELFYKNIDNELSTIEFDREGRPKRKLFGGRD
jgi:hypothetical protein